MASSRSKSSGVSSIWTRCVALITLTTAVWAVGYLRGCVGDLVYEGKVFMIVVVAGVDGGEDGGRDCC